MKVSSKESYQVDESKGPMSSGHNRADAHINSQETVTVHTNPIKVQARLNPNSKKGNGTQSPIPKHKQNKTKKLFPADDYWERENWFSSTVWC